MVFKDVLMICDRQGLIGREMFAIDGVKLPSNASKAKSGTRADFIRQADKLEAAAQSMLARHRENDTLPADPHLAEKSARRIERLNQEAKLDSLGLVLAIFQDQTGDVPERSASWLARNDWTGSPMCA